jgi:hypothetical protein
MVMSQKLLDLNIESIEKTPAGGAVLVLFITSAPD